jgi:Kef-type K+ transport system membrane component KefB/Trk K+ transport system NAD-binding subunit
VPFAACAFPLLEPVVPCSPSPHSALRRLSRWRVPLFGLGLTAILIAAAPGVAHAAKIEVQDSLVTSVGISIIAAAVFAYLGALARVPLLLTFLAAGVLIGPRIGFGLVSVESDIKAISEIGLLLLLFIIGLDIDIRKLKDSGKALLFVGGSQFVLCAALGLGFFAWLGFSIGHGSFEVLYLSVCCAASSTTLVAKLLYDKFELNTLPGQVTLGVLLFQNIYIMLFMRMQPNLGQSVLIEAILAVVKGSSLVIFSLLLSRFVLPFIFRRIAKIPELLLVTSLGWCFLIAGIAGYLGLSLVVGALVAGAALATFPYASDMAAKISSVRDFFLTLFFVSLGMQIPNPLEHPGILVTACVIAVFVIASRWLTMFPVLSAMRQGHRVSLLVPLNLSQTSEIGLLVATIGLEKGHIGQDILDIVIYVFVITSVLSSYFIRYNHEIQSAAGRLLVRLGLSDIVSKIEILEAEPQKEIAVLGFYQVASSLVDEILRTSAPLKDKLVVVDFNPQVHEKLQTLGVKVVYGDISQFDTLNQAGIEHAKVVISTVPDSVLRGTDNLKLIAQIRRLCPKARIIVTAESTARAAKMYEEGADYVLLPRIEAAKHLIPILDGLRAGGMVDLKLMELFALRERKEVIN